MEGEQTGHAEARVGVRRSSEPLSRSPRLDEIRDTEENQVQYPGHPQSPRPPSHVATPILAAPLPSLLNADTPHPPGHTSPAAIHRAPSIAPSTYSFHSSEPYQHHSSGYTHNRPPSLFGATTGASFRTTHTGWTGASASASAWALRFGPGVGAGADEGASMRALRRRGSAGSMESFESRWSWAPAMVGVQGRHDGVIV